VTAPLVRRANYRFPSLKAVISINPLVVVMKDSVQNVMRQYCCLIIYVEIMSKKSVNKSLEKRDSSIFSKTGLVKHCLSYLVLFNINFKQW
jgi:hypothetical protein